MSDKVGLDDAIAAGADRAAIEALPRILVTPTLAPEALHGLAGQIVETISPYSEADPVAILAHVLVGAGNIIGRGPHAMVEMTTHACNEFITLVGISSKGRKGQAWSTARWLFAGADEAWARSRIRSGLSSGEGLIYNVRDARYEKQPVKERGRVVDYQRVLVDEGETDKRLLVFEPEFASVLRRMQGETNSLGQVLRAAWDDGNLATLTRNAPLQATGAHASLIAHITREELITSLTDIDRANGFANRFLFFLVRRSKCIDDPVLVPEERLLPLVEKIQGVVKFAATPRRIDRNIEARALWAGVYPTLSEGEPGLLGAILARAEAHVLRLSLIYAVLDRSPEVRPAHLKAALAVWDFAETSARRIFGDRLGLPVSDTILDLLRAKGPLTRNDICNAFHRNRSRSEIDAALRLLEESRKVRRSVRPQEGEKGRPAEVWETC